MVLKEKKSSLQIHLKIMFTSVYWCSIGPNDKAKMQGCVLQLEREQSNSQMDRADIQGTGGKIVFGRRQERNNFTEQ